MTQTVYGQVTQKASYFSYFFTVSSVPNTEGNYSDVTVSHYWATNDVSRSFDTYSERAASITIEDETFSISKRFITGSNWANGNPYLIQTASKRIYHDAEGRREISISTRANGRASTYGPSSSTGSSGDCTAAAKITLDSIPRASTLTVTPNVICDGESAVVINAVKAVSSFRHRVSVSYREHAWTSEVFDASISYVLPKEWAYSTAAATGEATVVLTTYTDQSAETVVGSSAGSFTLHVPDTPEYYPQITDFTAVPVNDNATVDSWGIALQSYTRFKVNCQASAPDGAFITEYHFAGFGTGMITDKPEGTTTAIFAPGSGAFQVVVTDSRERTATAESETFTVLPYTKPVILNPVCYRCEDDGTPAASGTAVFLSAIAGFASCSEKNEVDLRCYYRASTISTYADSDYFTLKSAIGSVYGAGVFDASQDYCFKFILKDSLGTETESTEFTIEAADVLFNATDNEHLGIFGFADPSQIGATIYKPVHFSAGATGIEIPVEAYSTNADIGGISTVVNFFRYGKTTTMSLSARLSASARAEQGIVSIFIPEGFRPRPDCTTGNASTSYLLARGSYRANEVGAISVAASEVILFYDFLSGVCPVENWTLGATLTWINE